MTRALVAALRDRLGAPIELGAEIAPAADGGVAASGKPAPTPSCRGV